MDRKDKLRNMIKLLPDNQSDDVYFYEIIFYTGARPFAQTDSNVRSLLLKCRNNLSHFYDIIIFKYIR